MSDDQDQEHGEQQPAALPQADGPLIDVTLTDGQHLYAVVKSRRREPDAWWYDLQIHLPHQSSEHGRLLALPAAVDFRAPAALCAPVDGQPYDQVPTERPGVTLAWKVEEKIYFGPEKGPARIVHRGNCHAARLPASAPDLPKYPDYPRIRAAFNHATGPLRAKDVCEALGHELLPKKSKAPAPS